MAGRFLGLLALSLVAVPATAAAVLDIDFGQGASPVQPGFTSSFGVGAPSPSGVTLDLASYAGEPIQRFLEPDANLGPLGALVSDGILLPDDFLASTQGVAWGISYTLAGLDPGVGYEVTFFSPPQEGLNRVDARGASDGVFTPSLVYPDFPTLAVQPNAAGEITGSIDSVTGISFLSGLSVRLAVPEPSAAVMIALGLVGYTIRGDRQ